MLRLIEGDNCIEEEKEIFWIKHEGGYCSKLIKFQNKSYFYIGPERNIRKGILALQHYLSTEFDLWLQAEVLENGLFRNKNNTLACRLDVNLIEQIKIKELTIEEKSKKQKDLEPFFNYMIEILNPKYNPKKRH